MENQQECKHVAWVEETVGHCNNHGESNYQVTQVTRYCLDCGAIINVTVHDSRDA